MQRFYENWMGRSEDRRNKHKGQAMTKAEALQEAKHYVRTFTDSSGKQPLEHPCYWAAFILIGERE
jgi:CHAT domain-containing protein